MTDADLGSAGPRIAFSRENMVQGQAVPGTSTKTSVGLLVPCGHATRIDAVVKLTQNGNAYIRFYAAGGLLTWDSAAMALTANTVTPLAVATLSGTNSIGESCEIIFDTGTAATATGWLRAI